MQATRGSGKRFAGPLSDTVVGQGEMGSGYNVDIEWIEPWSPVADSAKLRLGDELQREVGDDHVLFGRDAEAVAVRCDCDDVLFVLRQPDALAVVHLTYAMHPERPPWPRTEVFVDMADFVNRRMKPDHEEYAVASQ